MMFAARSWKSLTGHKTNKQTKKDLNAPFYAPTFWDCVYKYPKYDVRLWHMTDFYIFVFLYTGMNNGTESKKPSDVHFITDGHLTWTNGLFMPRFN